MKHFTLMIWLSFNFLNDGNLTCESSVRRIEGNVIRMMDEMQRHKY